ncbi:MAG: maleylpyruvate isomerase family mycothiol-dependent enzyme [Phycisphaerales bacterium]
MNANGSRTIDVFALIAAQRRTLAEFCSTLSDAEWDTGSLCAGWTIKHVVAHLTAPFSISTPRFVLEILKTGGKFDVANDKIARRIADGATSAQLVQSLRANAEHRFTPPRFGAEAPLTDVSVHSLDIAVPLGRTIRVAPKALTITLDLLVSPKAAGVFGPKGHLDGLRLEASDHDWTYGPASGPLVTGPATSLVQALSGRPAGCASLTGGGVRLLAARLK